MTILVHRTGLLYWRVGERIYWRPRPGRLVRAWRWLTRGNWRVSEIDFKNETLTVERCR